MTTFRKIYIYFFKNNFLKAGSDVGTSEDEGVECSGSNCDSPNPCVDEAKRLDSLLRQNKQSRVNLKVNKYLNHASGHHTPPNSPNQTTNQVILCTTHLHFYSNTKMLNMNFY